MVFDRKSKLEYVQDYEVGVVNNYVKSCIGSNQTAKRIKSPRTNKFV